MNRPQEQHPDRDPEVEALLHKAAGDWSRQSEAPKFVAEFAARLAAEPAPAAKVVPITPAPAPARRWWSVYTATAAVAACFVLLLVSPALLGSGPLGQMLYVEGGLRTAPMYKKGTPIETQTAGRGIFQMDSGRVTMYVNGNTKMAPVGKDRVRLDAGDVWVVVKPNSGFFAVETPQGVVEVHGTTFGVFAGKSATDVTISSGKVRVASESNAAFITPGTRARMDATVSTAAVEGDVTPQWASDLHQSASSQKARQYFPSAIPIPKH